MLRVYAVTALVITVVLTRQVVYRCLYRKHRATLTTRRNQLAEAQVSISAIRSSSASPTTA